MSVEQLEHVTGAGQFRRHEEPSPGELLAQRRCEHRWMVVAMGAASGGFKFRSCPRCGKKVWEGAEGPVGLEEVLRALVRSRTKTA